MSDENKKRDEDLGIGISSKMDEMGLKPAELSRMSTVNAGHISQISRGKHCADTDTLRKLCDALQCLPCELMRYKITDSKVRVLVAMDRLSDVDNLLIVSLAERLVELCENK